MDSWQEQVDAADFLEEEAYRAMIVEMLAASGWLSLRWSGTLLTAAIIWVLLARFRSGQHTGV